jgi:superfamily II RNA helicase
MSVLAKELKKEYELAQEYIQAGFHHAFLAGELLAEVEKLAGAEEVEAWLQQNCSEIEAGEAKQFLRLFKGETVKVSASRQPEEKEVQET